LTSAVLGYPVGSVGRRMTPEFVSTHPDTTAGQTLERVRHRIDEVETIYALPVTDGQRRLVGVVGLRAVVEAGPGPPIHEPTNASSCSPWSTRRAASSASSPSTTPCGSSRTPSPRTPPARVVPSPCAVRTSPPHALARPLARAVAARAGRGRHAHGAGAGGV